MKNCILLVLTLFLINCTTDNHSTDEESQLLGKWRVIEQLLDPGDGSGTFKPITSDRTVEFFSNGEVTTNGVLCYLTSEIGANSTGNYIATISNDFRDGEITPSDCNYEGTKVFYKIEGVNLILWYQCIEGCGQKFEKMK